MTDPLEAAAKDEAMNGFLTSITDGIVAGGPVFKAGNTKASLDLLQSIVAVARKSAPLLTAPLLAEIARLTRELEEATKTRETLSQMHLQMCDLATERFSALSTVEAERDRLRKAATNLRAAQRAYMANRGNDELGRAVAAAAQAMDDTLLGETGR